MGLFGAIGAAVNVGANLISGHYNRKLQRETNQQQLDYARESYAKQRADALYDVQQANAFNSPAQQMQRYKEAGLNPNLIYGSATNQTSATVRSSNAPSYNPTAPKFENPIPGALAAYVNISQMMAQTENLRAMAELNKTKGAIAEIDLAHRDTMLTQGIGLTAAKRFNEELRGSIGSQTAEMQVEYMAQKLLNSQKDGYLKDQMRLNLMKEADLKTLDYVLRAHGLDGSDPLYIKSLMKFLTTGLLDDAFKIIDSTSKFR